MIDNVEAPPELTDLVYTVAQAAKVLKVGVDKCYDLVREGSLESTKISSRNYRISRRALMAYIDGGSAEG